MDNNGDFESISDSTDLICKSYVYKSVKSLEEVLSSQSIPLDQELVYFQYYSSVGVTKRDIIKAMGLEKRSDVSKANWLNSRIVNGYMHLLQRFDDYSCAKEPTRKRSIFLSDFISTQIILNTPYAWGLLTNAFEKDNIGNIFEAKRLHMPVNKDKAHWCKIVISFYPKSKTIIVCWYDSYHSSGTNYFFIAKRLLEREASRFDINLDSYIIKYEDATNMPHQSNDYDCGVFMLMVSKSLADGSSVKSFSQETMFANRREIAEVLLAGGLEKVTEEFRAPPSSIKQKPTEYTTQQEPLQFSTTPDKISISSPHTLDISLVDLSTISSENAVEVVEKELKRFKSILKTLNMELDWTLKKTEVASPAPVEAVGSSEDKDSSQQDQNEEPNNIYLPTSSDEVEFIKQMHAKEVFDAVSRQIVADSSSKKPSILLVDTEDLDPSLDYEGKCLSMYLHAGITYLHSIILNGLGGECNYLYDGCLLHLKAVQKVLENIKSSNIFTKSLFSCCTDDKSLENTFRFLSDTLYGGNIHLTSIKISLPANTDDQLLEFSSNFCKEFEKSISANTDLCNFGIVAADITDFTYTTTSGRYNPKDFPLVIAHKRAGQKVFFQTIGGIYECKNIKGSKFLARIAAKYDGGNYYVFQYRRSTDVGAIPCNHKSFPISVSYDNLIFKLRGVILIQQRMQMITEKASYSYSPDEKLRISPYVGCITVRDLSILKRHSNDKWLTDIHIKELLHSFFSNSPDHVIIPPSVAERMDDFNYERSKPLWDYMNIFDESKKEGYFHFPFNYPTVTHWIYALIYPFLKTVVIYDPSYSERSVNGVKSFIHEYIMLEACAIGDANLGYNWEFKFLSDCQQSDSNNCGVFICCAALNLKYLCEKYLTGNTSKLLSMRISPIKTWKLSFP